MNLFKFIFLSLSSLAILVSCSNKNNYVIEGTINNPRLEGAMVYLVPLDKEYRHIHGVDSTLVQNMKFSFSGSEEFLARVTVDYRMRFGCQELLVVTEPGEIRIILDSISEGHGTPQNDALQRWKNLKFSFDKDRFAFMKLARQLKEKGDTTRANAILDSIELNNKLFKGLTLSIANSLEEGTAHDFLISLYPNKDED